MQAVHTNSERNTMRTEDRPGPSRAGAFVITDKDKYIVGRVVVAYPKDGAGRLYVSLYDWTGQGGPTHQTANATGYGYDKVASALSDMSFGKIKLTDHPEDWTRCLKSAGYEAIRVL